MIKNAHKLLVDLLSLPTSPFNEQYVAGYIRRWAAGRPGLELTGDEFGNLRIRLRRGPAAASPLVFSAHMDHPGFEAQAMIRPGRLRALWRGGVLPEYFPGAKVRFYSDGAWIRGVIESVKIVRDLRGRRRVRTATIAVKKAVAPGSIGMWDFPDPLIRGSRLYARGCDDVAGAAAILAAFDQLSEPHAPASGGRASRPPIEPEAPARGRRASYLPIEPEAQARGGRVSCLPTEPEAQARAIRPKSPPPPTKGSPSNPQSSVPLDLYATFTRAEEVGFAGAIATAAHSSLLPHRARIVAVETSSEIPGVKMGEGPILRVGDRDAIFTPALTAFCRQVADDLARQDKTFKYQRKLMDGGTCESAAFCEYGYEATGLCVALGNYHNMDPRRKRLAAEYIDLRDWNGLVKWFVALATSRREYRPRGNPAFREVLDRLDKEYTPLLRKTTGRTLSPMPPPAPSTP